MRGNIPRIPNDPIAKALANAQKFFGEFGKQPKDAVKPRIIDPKLQRTLASGTEQGVTLGTKRPIFKVVQDGVVRLKNRSVPQNSKGSGSK